MTLEENIQQLRDGLIVTSAQTLRHETRVKEHQEWLEQMELSFARMAKMHEEHAKNMLEFDEKMTQVAAAQLLSEEKLARLSEKVDAFLDGLRKGTNGHQ